jgi:hypothetical protein
MGEREGARLLNRGLPEHWRRDHQGEDCRRCKKFQIHSLISPFIGRDVRGHGTPAFIQVHSSLSKTRTSKKFALNRRQPHQTYVACFKAPSNWEFYRSLCIDRKRQMTAGVSAASCRAEAVAASSEAGCAARRKTLPTSTKAMMGGARGALGAAARIHGLSARLKLDREKVIDRDQHDQQPDAETEAPADQLFLDRKQRLDRGSVDFVLEV